MVSFHFEKAVQLKDRKILKTFINQIFENEGKVFKVGTIIFCSDAYLLKINRDFLQHDYFTDIITFNLAGPKEAAIVGEIYISVDSVYNNSIERKIQFTYELHRVIFHGVLHLCGYKDKTKSEVKAMRAREDYYLSQYFDVPRETFERMY